ncbi:MAG: stage 0 sporulation family protein [Pirellula sp.]
MTRCVVRCGVNRTLYAMQSKFEHGRGDAVIARTNRGLEQGEVLCEITETNAHHTEQLPGGSIQRLVSEEDRIELDRLAALKEVDFRECSQLIAQMQMKLSLIEVERILGGEQVTLYYTASDRIDFRDIVKRLAARFHTRIEMRQVGARDEAKLLGDYGDCGKPLCCNTHLPQMPPVSMRMAKLQKATLDPNKISGRCGRLKCCLRYEQDHYEELAAALPNAGSDIVTREGRARVLAVELLAKQLLVSTEDNRRILISADDCLSVLKRGAEPS